MEVRSEPGIFPSGASVQKSAAQAPPTIQSMRLAYTQDGTAIYKPISSTSPSPTPLAAAAAAAPAPAPHQGGGGGSASSVTEGSSPVTLHGLSINIGEPVKKKRGRPRKYGPDGTMALALNPTSAAGSMPSAGFSSSVNSDPTKKVKGRPLGSGKKQQMAALGSAGIGFTPHVITVNAGEDVSSKIMSFSQHGPRSVCILSANGAISNVTLRQAATSGGTVTYEGRFEILSLSGSYLLSERSGQRSRTGGLSVSLAGPDGRVLGGGVAGILTAASPVQVVVGSFIGNGKKEAKQTSPLDLPSSVPVPVPMKLTPIAPIRTSGASSPPSHGTLSESSGGGSGGSPLNQLNIGALNNNQQQQEMPTFAWK